MAPNPESTKRELIAAAEVLFAARGIDGVSLREINAAAGQKNSTALQYHFRDRYGLLEAIIAKHLVDVDAHRNELLDAYEYEGIDDLRALAGALVRPSAMKLGDAEGRAYLQIHAQVVNRPEYSPDDPFQANLNDSLDRWRELVGALLPDVAVRRLHHRFTAVRVSATELARRAAATPRRDDKLFTSHLIDLVTSLLTTPQSAETSALLARKPAPARP